MGVHLVTGVEIECSVQQNLIPLVTHFQEMKQDAEAREVPTLASKSKDWINSVTRKLSGFEALNDSRHMRRGAIQHSYDDGRDLEVTTRPESPLRTAYWVSGIRKILMECTDEVSQKLKEEGIPLGRHAAKIHEEKITPGNLYFGSQTQHMPYGEHINLSIHPVSPDRSDYSYFDLSAANLTADEGWRKVISYALALHTTHDGIALYGGPKSIERQTIQSGSVDLYDSGRLVAVPVTARDGDVDSISHVLDQRCRGEKSGDLSSGEANRVEFRLPDSQSNIFLTTLLTISAVYATIKAAKSTFPEKLPKKLSPKGVDAIVAELDKMHPKSRILPHTVREGGLRLQSHSLIAQMAEDVCNERDSSVSGDMKNLTIALIKRAEDIERDAGLAR